MIRITNLKLNLDDAIDYASELANLRKLFISKYNIKPNHLLLIKLYRKAIDARRKTNVHFVYTIDAEVCNEEEYLKRDIQNMSVTPDMSYKQVKKGNIDLKYQPVVIGFGPSGIFAALLLARRGYSPIVIERGLDIDNRTEAWNDFLKSRKFTEKSSILYGEGGAGTFSDGKLTTLINDIRCRIVLEELVKAGAHPEIMYVSKPHIGTDVLKKVIKNIREEIIKSGGFIRFGSKVTDFLIKEDRLTGIEINHQEIINTEVCLLGIGHSARDTFELLYKKSMVIQQKPFSVGLRIEHPQDLINKSQYGEFHNHPALGAAEYKLSHHLPNGRSCYTFCMCPGGYVVNAVSEDKMVVTNGMSYSKRDGINANSAVLVNVTPNDFKSNHPLAGIEFQRRIECLAYQMAGHDYSAPIQTVKAFLNHNIKDKIGSVIPTIEPAYHLSNLRELLPDFVVDTLIKALPEFDKKIKGFAMPDAILTGPETRSSSPIRMVRDEQHQSNLKGIYPMGEGAGYAGGIMSSAVDGIKTAEEIIKKYIF